MVVLARCLPSFMGRRRAVARPVRVVKEWKNLGIAQATASTSEDVVCLLLLIQLTFFLINDNASSGLGLTFWLV